MSGDVSENPGPIRFPCGKCQKPAKINQRGIQCESCPLWHHATCIDMPVSEYNYLSNSSDDWYCYLCTLPPFTYSFFSTNLDETNESIGNLSNAPLVDSLPLTPETTSDVNTDIFDALIDTSKKHPDTFMCSFLNTNSYRYKFCSIKDLLLENTIDMLIIAETKLDETFPYSQFEVENDHLWRADRSSHGGGMLLCVGSDLACDRKVKLECKEI
jgi:hypothetical protein